MNDRIDMSYFAYGNRDFKCLKQPESINPSASVKSSASNILQRNYLDFDPGVINNNYSINTSNNLYKKINNNINQISEKKLIRSTSVPNFDINQNNYYKYHPEYKIYRKTNEQNRELNNYLNPIEQYTYKDNPKIKTVEQLFCVQKSKTNFNTKNENKNNEYDYIKLPSPNKNKNINKIILKKQQNNNILIPNNFHIQNNNNIKNINIDDVKYNSFLESEQTPEYLKNYDIEGLKNIENYYISKHENTYVLSKCGEWITLSHGGKIRDQVLEKLKHGTNETSIIAPIWMDIAGRRKNFSNFNNKNYNKNIFKSYQYKNRDGKDRMTVLIDRDQKNAKPSYLRNVYEK